MKSKMIDGSGDKEFFTIIPNYIPDHSSATDLSLYVQMKKVAGESGECFITEENLCKKMEIGKTKLRKSIKYLLAHKWIAFVGRTRGKTRPVNTYKIENIWELNMKYYQDKKIRTKSAVSKRNKKDTYQISSKIRTKTDHKEEPYIKKNHIILSNGQATTGKEFNDLLYLFKPVNPSYERLFPNKSQRASLERLVEKHGVEKITNVIKCLPEAISKPYAPRITTPCQLEQKLGDLIAFLNQEKMKGGGAIDARHT